jgi:hypothetical protein
LIETIVAVSLIAILLLEVVGVQGNAVYAGSYARRSLQAVWLGKRLMTQVEYYWATRDFKDLKEDIKERPFDDMKDYSYSLEIKDFKLPLVDMLAGGVGAGGGDDEDEGEKKESGDSGTSGVVKTAMDQFLGDEILKTARVTVYWSEGARRDSTTLAMLLTNQKKVEEGLISLKAMVGTGNPASSGTAPGATPPGVPPPPEGTP